MTDKRPYALRVRVPAELDEAYRLRVATARPQRSLQAEMLTALQDHITRLRATGELPPGKTHIDPRQLTLPFKEEE